MTTIYRKCININFLYALEFKQGFVRVFITDIMSDLAKLPNKRASIIIWLILLTS